MNGLILILIFSLLLTSCGRDNDSSDPVLNEPVFIPMVGYDTNSTGLSGVWKSACVLSEDLAGFKTAKIIYVISQNSKTIKNIFSFYKKSECQGENTTLTFVMSCENRGTKMVESGIMVEKNHCTKDRFWRESKKEGLVKLDKKIDFKIILYQSEANTLYSNANIDSSEYPNNIEWGLPYARRIFPIGLDTGILQIYCSNTRPVDVSYWPHDVIGCYLKYREHVNAHILYLKEAILDDPRVKDILSEIRS